MVKNSKIYIKSAKQISIQEPLKESWMLNPIIYSEPFNRSLDPNFKEYLVPNQARRLGKLLGRALVTSVEALKEANIVNPDAIITGTGLGCVENTELFLNALTFEGEQFLKPTYFMQSTHNTISSLVSIHTKTHGYNVTYAHKSISFDSALYDAYLQFALDKINNALVGSHDELTPSYFELLRKIGFLGIDNEIAGEAAVSVVLDRNIENAICVLSGCKILYNPSVEKLKTELMRMLKNADILLDDIDGVMLGVSGNKENDAVYHSVVGELFASLQLLHYKHIFGESYSSSALGFYSAVECFKYGFIPDKLFLNRENAVNKAPKNILLLNHSDGKNFSLILLKSLCGR